MRFGVSSSYRSLGGERPAVGGGTTVRAGPEGGWRKKKARSEAAGRTRSKMASQPEIRGAAARVR
jgi:hypothetical protein